QEGGMGDVVGYADLAQAHVQFGRDTQRVVAQGNRDVVQLQRIGLVAPAGVGNRGVVGIGELACHANAGEEEGELDVVLEAIQQLDAEVQVEVDRGIADRESTHQRV